LQKAIQFISRREWLVALYAMVTAFLAYATVYGFRKTYTVATFPGETIFGIGFKEALVISQALGYMSSKFFGIRFIAQLKRIGRWKIILTLVGISWLAWLMFAIVPTPWNVAMLFVNGFPLGLLWGVVFSYVEGRKTTDLIGTGMAVSFIFSSGLVKSIGQLIMTNWHVSELWMPFVAGGMFIPFLLLFVFMLEKIPRPTSDDVNHRTSRIPMSAAERASFTKMFLPGLILLVLVYVFLTVFRDLRDNFIADMWIEMGYRNPPSVFTTTEIPITLLVLAVVGSMIVVRNNFKAFIASHWIVVLGFVVAGGSTLLFQMGMLMPFAWVILVGTGLYLGYIPFNCILFERMIASFRKPANIGFLIYVADSFGYVASVSVILVKAFLASASEPVQWVNFYSSSVMYLSVLGVALTICSVYYFSRKHKQLLQRVA
jgi:MFS family permease